MLLLVADENLNQDIVRGLLRRKADMDIVCIQDVGLSGADDPKILEWAAVEGRILLTHDVATMTRYAYERISEGRPMPGLFEVNISASLGQVIEDILLLEACSLEGEWEARIGYLPFKS